MMGLCAGRVMGLETADAAQAQAKLAEVRSRIAAVTSSVATALRDRDQMAARLRDADLQLAANQQRLEHLRAAQLGAERHRAGLRSEEVQIQRGLAQQRADLAAQVRAAYMMGHHEGIRLLLSQDDPGGAGRELAYYAFFARARAAQIEQIRARVARVRELAASIERASAQLHALQLDAGREALELSHAREARATALVAVANELRNGSNELARLRQQELAEETLIGDLADVLQDVPMDSQESFDGLRGKLPWPVIGTIAAHYQDTRNGMVPRLNGILIDAPRGSKVRAPYFGRVVYADWLQGLGLLLIIGHSGNFMTLYGHAEVLYKSVGDWVAPGDVIASMGDAGSPAPQLYFEIRDGRRSVDPKAWLKPGS